MATILQDTKEMLGIGASYNSFNVDIINDINAAVYSLIQLGVVDKSSLGVSEDSAWDEIVSDKSILVVKTYIYLKVRLAFDPPATSFGIDAIKKQIDEIEFRLSIKESFE